MEKYVKSDYGYLNITNADHFFIGLSDRGSVILNRDGGEYDILSKEDVKNDKVDTRKMVDFLREDFEENFLKSERPLIWDTKDAIGKYYSKYGLSKNN